MRSQYVTNSYHPVLNAKQKVKYFEATIEVALFEGRSYKN